VTTVAGLSPAMLTVLRAVGERKVRCDVYGPRKLSRHYGWDVTSTVKALVRRELIALGERDRRWVTWELTDAGRAVLNQLGGTS
jgi:DNA-binding MarR family transcriptional regulator